MALYEKGQVITKVLTVYSGGNMNVCNKLYGPSIIVETFQCGPKWLDCPTD